MIFTVDGKLTLVFLRGDRQLNEAKLRRLFPGAELEMATDAAAMNAVGIAPGYTGPIGVSAGVRMVADPSVAGLTNLVTGANREGYHYRGANWDRDMAQPELADITLVMAGDGCPKCGMPLNFSRGIEAGQIFKLGTKYSESLHATFLDEEGKEQFFVMGCYGIGITRTIAAAIEQHHDANGIIWPMALAPFEVVLTNLSPTKIEVIETADGIYQQLLDVGVEVLYDDRELSPGFKLKDADLIGIPLRVVVSEKGLKKGTAEIKARNSSETSFVLVEEKVREVMARLEEMRNKQKE
jgi:prolyl-tRNA synthetase